MRCLTRKQEQFCLKYLELGNGAEAVKQAGYSPKWVSRHLRDLLKSPAVQARIEELKNEVGSDRRIGVISIQERKIRLSQIIRATLGDFMELGQDGSWVNIGKENQAIGAVKEIHSRTEYDDDGAHPTVHTSVKLHDPMQAIDLLNKMEHLYSDNPVVNVQNNVVFVIGKGYANDPTTLPADKPDSGKLCQITG